MTTWSSRESRISCRMISHCCRISESARLRTEVLSFACAESLMGELWECYWSLQWKYLPMWVIEYGICVMLIGIVACVWKWGLRKGSRYCAWIMLIDYFYLICCSLVFFRQTAEERSYGFTPFWSYCKMESFVESMMNVALFMPIGLLLCVAVSSMTWKKAMIIGSCLSAGIEIMQFVFKKGFAEFDDVFHNVIGCLIGFGIWKVFQRVRYKSFMTY